MTRPRKRSMTWSAGCATVPCRSRTSASGWAEQQEPGPEAEGSAMSDELTEDLFDLAADVVVVGSGAAGTAAAATAANEGAQVLVLERAAEIGGTTALAGCGAWVPNNSLMRAEGATDPRGPALRFMTSLSY